MQAVKACKCIKTRAKHTAAKRYIFVNKPPVFFALTNQKNCTEYNCYYQPNLQAFNVSLFIFMFSKQ